MKDTIQTENLLFNKYNIKGSYYLSLLCLFFLQTQKQGAGDFLSSDFLLALALNNIHKASHYTVNNIEYEPDVEIALSAGCFLAGNMYLLLYDKRSVTNIYK